jgi:VanZ family protein
MGTRHPTVYRLLFLTIALIVYGCLYPWRFDFTGDPRHPLLVLLNSWPPIWDRFALRDAAINLLLYLPFGATGLWAWSRRFPRVLGIAPVLLAALALSCGMEMLQVYVPGRVCSLFDVLCNVAGAAVGVALALVYHPASTGRRKHAAIPASGLLLLVLFAGYQMYPFFPVLSQTRVRRALELLGGAEAFSLHEVWCSAAEWFAAMLLVALVLHLRPALALLCLPLRILVATRTLALHEVLGAALAWLVWTLLRERVRLRAAAGFLAAAIVMRELAPFHFAGPPAAFSWIPFWSTFDSERQSALVILFRKAFDYGAMVWLLRAVGVSYVRAGAVVAAGLAALEAAQRYLPGRIPESTDAVLVLLLTVGLWSLDNFPRHRGLA